MKIKTLLVAALAAFALLGCKKDDPLYEGIPSITINGEKYAEISIGQEGGSAKITIKSNRDWKVREEYKAEAEWINVSVKEAQKATAAQEVTVTALPNDGKNAFNHEYSLIFTNGTKNSVLLVKQEGPRGESGNIFDAKFATSLDGFTVEDEKGSGIWTFDSKYTCAKATGYLNSANTESVSWLISPEIDLATEAAAFLSFDHAGNFFADSEMTKQITLWIREVGTSNWTQLTIPNMPSNKDYNFVNSGAVDLVSWLGKKIQIALKYMSTTAKAGTWEVKNLSIARSNEALELDSIAEIFGLDEGLRFSISNVTVSALMTNSYVVTDGTDHIVAFGSPGELKIKDKVNISGAVASHNSVKQISNPVADVTGTDAGFVYPTARDITSTFDSFSSDKPVYVKFSGEIVKSGSYYNVTVDGATKGGSIAYPTEALQVDSYIGLPVTVEGYYIYTGGNYLNVAATNIIPAGDYLTLSPTQATVAYNVTSTTISIRSNVSWSVGCPAGITATPSSGTGDATVTLTFSSNSGDSPIVSDITVSGAAEPKTFTLTQNTANTKSYADFETIGRQSSFKTYTSTAGWVIENGRVLEGAETDASSSGKFIFIGKSAANPEVYAQAPTMNGKTSAPGTITSPELDGGCGTLSFQYGEAFAETKPASFKLEIIQGGVTVKTETITDATIEKCVAHSKSITVNVSGKFIVKFTNLCPAGKDSNADRVSIWNLGWTAYSGN